MDIAPNSLVIGDPFIKEEVNFVPLMGGQSFFGLSIERSTIFVLQDSGPEGIRVMIHPP